MNVAPADSTLQPEIIACLFVKSSSGLLLVKEREHWMLPRTVVRLPYERWINTFLHDNFGLTAKVFQPFWMLSDSFNGALILAVWCRDIPWTLELKQNIEARYFNRKETHQLREEGLLTPESVTLLSRHSY